LSHIFLCVPDLQLSPNVEHGLQVSVQGAEENGLLLMKNKTAVLKKGMNHAEIIKDVPLDVQELLGLEPVSSGPSRASGIGAGQ
jgi:hypothetical protein